MASSGKCWGATKHWLAVKGGIVEPKEVIIETKKIEYQSFYYFNDNFLEVMIKNYFSDSLL